jgi:DNA mismatch repair protein MutS
LETTHPSEIIISKKQSKELDPMIAKMSSAPSVTRLEEWIFEQGFADDLIKRQFETRSLKGFGIDGMPEAVIAAGAVLHYISETQQGSPEQIRFIRRHEPSEYMALDNSTRRNLEITWSMSDNSGGTLISILDKTCTAMGGRLFKKWIAHPLKNLEPIKTRLNAVSTFVENSGLRAETRELLNQTGDLERLIAKTCSGRATPRDAVSLKNSLVKCAELKELLLNSGNSSLSAFTGKLRDVSEVSEMIEKAIIDEPAAKTGYGNVFREGYNPELDGYIEAKYSGKSWIAKYQEKERADSGIPTLKVGFNNVFGYYIEITKVHSSKVPERYERKQTLTNSERYTTPEIKEMESKIFGAEEKILELENRLFRELLAEIAVFTENIQENASIIAAVDCLQGFAEAANEFNYCKPALEDSHVLKIDEGRHPVVEKMLPVGEKFTPNSTLLDKNENQIHILTGPNMSGKSCYLRQVALIVLLAQIGSYVPAKSAQIGIVDRIFTRVGAQGQSFAWREYFPCRDAGSSQYNE